MTTKMLQIGKFIMTSYTLTSNIIWIQMRRSRFPDSIIRIKWFGWIRLCKDNWLLLVIAFSSLPLFAEAEQQSMHIAIISNGLLPITITTPIQKKMW